MRIPTRALASDGLDTDYQWGCEGNEHQQRNHQAQREAPERGLPPAPGSGLQAARVAPADRRARDQGGTQEARQFQEQGFVDIPRRTPPDSRARLKLMAGTASVSAGESDGGGPWAAGEELAAFLFRPPLLAL